MRIIKHGDRNELKEFYFECGNCGCYFVAEVCECSVHFYMITRVGVLNAKLWFTSLTRKLC